MNKISKLRKTLLVFFIVSLSLIAAFAALYVLNPMFLNNNNPAMIGPTLDLGFRFISQSFVLPFNQAQAGDFIGAYIALGETIPLTLSILVYVISGVMLILMVLGIVFVNSKRKPLYTLYSFAILAATYIAYIMITYGFIYIATAKTYFDPSLGAVNVGLGIAECVVFSLGCLAFVAVIATTILGIIYANKAAKALDEEEPAPATVAELAGDPEAVQEGEELLAPAEAPEIESEPEPVPEEIAEEEPVPEEEIQEEPAEEAKILEEPKEENQQRVEVNVNNNAAPAQQATGLDQASLASLLREVVRDIVRDEIARNNLNQPQQPQQSPNGNQTITGATFGGPLVVQYFNGGINGVTPPAPETKVVEKVVEVRNEEPKPAPVQPAPAPVEEKKEEPKPAQRQLFVKKEKVEEPKPAPAVEAAPAEEKKEEPKKYERLSFAERLLQSEKDVHDLYNEVKNEILSYGVKSRISAVGDTFRLHKKMYVRITVAGKSLKLYFALNPADYANSTLPIQDASDKDMYQEIPLVFKVKSPLSVRRCKELIQDVMEKDGLEQGEIGKVNWVKELKAEMASGKKPEAED